MPRIGFVILATAIITVACAQEPDLHFDVIDAARPSFSFSGRSIALSFEISELPQGRPLSKTYGLEGKKVWKISTSRGENAAQWPRVAYGEVPDGFSQVIPEHDVPPQLVVGKLYVARLVGLRDDTTSMYFEIADGKLVNVTDKVFGP